ncbi:MAG TPA: ABC transporter ATP-binding protein [Acidimicrobiales bacterium]|nr:ABC transporter ATP-binding protein [Acidimicrobiales bacterium]
MTRMHRDDSSSSHHAGGIWAVGLEKSYGPVRAVRGINLHIAPGETVALLGPNGAGKSTTMDMVLGLTHPDAGSVSVFGVPPGDAVRAGWVGGMLQTGSVPDLLKVRELVSLIASYYPRPLLVDDVLAMTGADQFADRWTTTLSGGQIQRTRFAAALVGNPDLLVLDEPTAGVDVEGRLEFWRAARMVAGSGKTIMFATHYLEEADEFADRIVVMAQGRIIADGPATEVKARAGSRTIRATLAGVDPPALRQLPGVVSADRHGDTVILSCSDSDVALKEMLARWSGAHDIEVRSGSLEEAFLELTAEAATGDDTSDGTGRARLVEVK